MRNYIKCCGMKCEVLGHFLAALLGVHWGRPHWSLQALGKVSLMEDEMQVHPEGRARF